MDTNAPANDFDAEFPREYVDIPEHTKHALYQWKYHGRPSGDFLHAVLINDLQSAFAHADDENLVAMRLIVRWIFNRLPSAAWHRHTVNERMTAIENLNSWKGLANV